MHNNEPNLLSPDAYYDLKVSAPKCVAAWAPPQSSWGRLRSLSVFKGDERRGDERIGEMEKEERE